MLDHVSLGSHDFPRAVNFYTDLFATIGYRRHKLDEKEAAFGPGDEWTFFVYPAAADQAVTGARMHLAFRVADRATANRFHAAALELGGRAPNPPRPPAHRPEFGEDYYGGMFLDPDGHAIEILTRGE
jgi:catechol 2,3-dioxygenase-like lactoylglutathione lyase family enzyme